MDRNISMYRIAIIGSGQLGSRHLQGLLKMEIPLSIDVVDSSQASLELAKNRASEIETQLKDIRYLTNIEALKNDIDLCIIATGANVRLTILETLLKLKKVQNLILEKVLFQSLGDFQIADNLIKKHGINCWVNCPRPMFDFYKNIKSKIGKDELITYMVSGGEWGLACNAIHFIDNMAFLSCNTQFVYDTSGISSVIESKRKGFVEFSGTLIGRQPNGSELILHSRNYSDAKLRIHILTDNYSWEIDEIDGTVLESSKKSNWKVKKQKIKIPFQSEITNVFVKQILYEGKCDLSTYRTSMNLHLDMLSSFINVYNFKTGQHSKICPIT